MSSVPAPPDLAPGDGDFTAGGWADEPAPGRTPAPRPRSLVADAPPPGAQTVVPGTSTRTPVLVLVLVLLELLAAGCVLALAAAVWEVRAHTHVLSGIPVVGELPSALFWVSVVLGALGSVLALLVWPTCRGGLWARRVVLVLLMVGALPGLLAGLLPGVAMVLAVVVLARPDVRAHFAGRRGTGVVRT